MGYVYATDPIDFWNGWHKPDDILGTCGKELTDTGEGSYIDIQEYNKRLEELKEKALDLGWEGDICQGPFVSVFPQTPGDYCHPKIMIGFKQRSNGTTFIYSGWKLPMFDNDSSVQRWPGW